MQKARGDSGRAAEARRQRTTIAVIERLLAASGLVETPVLTTIHGFSSQRILPAFKAYEDHVHYVAISDADRHPDLRYAATIHHGIRLEDFPFDPHGSEDLLFFGRIHRDKGTREAIELAYFGGLTQQEIAERTSSPLGTVKTRVRLGLMKLRERVRPYLSGQADGS